MENQVLIYIHRHPNCSYDDLVEFFEGRIYENDLLFIIARLRVNGWLMKNRQMQLSVKKELAHYFRGPSGYKGRPAEYRAYCEQTAETVQAG